MNSKIEELRAIEISQFKDMCTYCCMEILLKSLGIGYEEILDKYPQYTGRKSVQEILLRYSENNFPGHYRRICDLTDAIKKLNLGVEVIREWRSCEQKRNGDFITIEQIEDYVRKYEMICVNLYGNAKDDMGHSNIIYQFDILQKCFHVIDPTDKNKLTLSYCDFENKWINKDVPFSELFIIHKSLPYSRY